MDGPCAWTRGDQPILTRPLESIYIYPLAIPLKSNVC